MPDGLSARATLLLVALALGWAFAVQALVSGWSSVREPAAVPSTLAPVADAPVAQPHLRPAGPDPALREARRPRRQQAHRRKPQRRVRKTVKAARTVQPAPVTPAATVQPTPTASPHYIPPAPPRRTPAAELTPAAPKPTPAAPKPTPAAPKPTPAPTSSPPSGEFDTTGESP